MTIETKHCYLVYEVNTAPFQVRRALKPHPPSWCECTGRHCGAPQRRREFRARRPLSEDSQEPRNREPPWSRGQACHQYPHEDGRGPSGGARCHITRRHITTHLYTSIRHFYLSLYRTKHGTKPSFITKVTTRLRVDSGATRAILIRASNAYTGCLLSRHHDSNYYVAILSTKANEVRRKQPSPRAWGPHTCCCCLAHTIERKREAVRQNKSIEWAATNATGSQRIYTIITDIDGIIWFSGGNNGTANQNK